MEADDSELAFELQVEEALTASLRDDAVSPPNATSVPYDPVFGSVLSKLIQRDHPYNSEHEILGQDKSEVVAKRLRVDLSRQIQDRALACQIQNVNRPYGEGSSSSNNKPGLRFRIHIKGLIEKTVGGVGVAICDVNGGLMFQLSKGFDWKEQQVSDKGFVELKALLEGLDFALSLGLGRIRIVTDTTLLYQFITGKSPRGTRKVSSLGDQINLAMRNFTSTRVSLVETKEINFAMELARNAIALKQSAGGSSNAKNLTESCDICFEDAYVDQMFSIAGCLHRYCFSCMSKHVQSKLLQGSLPKCPHENCKSELKLKSCKKFLTPELFGILSQRVKEARIPTEDKFYCPYLKCSTLLLRTKLRGSTGPIKCPKCSGNFCFSCKVPWHRKMTCSEFKTKNPFGCKEEKKLKVLAKKNRWRECSKCKHMVSIGEGCYHINCRCGHKFCYQCGAEWKNKKACTCPIWNERNIIYDQQHRRRAR